MCLINILLYLIIIIWLSFGFVVINSLFIKRKDIYKVFIISLLYFIVLNIIHYMISIEMNRDGFSILTKKLLDDEIIYHYTSLYLSNHVLDINKILEYQQNMVGYSSFKSIFFSIIIAFFYKLFIPNILIAKAIVTFFSSLVIVEFYLILNLFLKQKTALIFSLFLLLYPNFIIHSIQLERDTFLLFLLLLFYYFIFKKIFFQQKINYFIILFLFIVLMFFRPQYGVLILFTIILLYIFKFKKLYNNKYKIIFLMILFIIIMPIPLLVFKQFYPSFFVFIEHSKNYSVFAGQVGFMEVNYNTYFGILITLLKSFYYFLFAPISSYAISGNLFWKVLMMEPIFFLIIFYIIVLKYFKYYNNFYIAYKKIFVLLLMSLLFYTYLSTVFETHISGYMRKRMIIYFIIYFLFIFLINKIKFFKKRGNI